MPWTASIIGFKSTSTLAGESSRCGIFFASKWLVVSFFRVACAEITCMKYLITVLLFLLVLIGSDSYARLTDPGNRHNLSANQTSVTIQANTETRICVFCHTPHGGTPQSQLWNRKDPTTTFPLYAGAVTIKSVPDAQYDNTDPTAYPNGATRMCLSCHDGISAIGEVINGLPQFAAQVAMNFDTLQAAGSSAAVDLALSHPVSFVYTPSVVSQINTIEAATNYKSPAVVPLDGQSRMQCTTCHDPHEDTSAGGGYSLPFWRNYTGDDVADYDSTCNDCHVGGAGSFIIHNM